MPRVHGDAMTIGSLFSGIGGLDLGVEHAGFGPTVWQVEIDPFARGILARHWPKAKQHIDVVTVGKHNLEVVDLLIGGFPCQGNSVAGKGLGLADPRSGLWREFRRIVEEIRPTCAIVENVAGGARRWLPHVRRDLHMLGYRTRALALSAFDVGAPHLRRRVFVLAADPKRVTLRDEQQRLPARRKDRVSDQGKDVAPHDGAKGSSSDRDGQGQLESRGREREGWRWTRVLPPRGCPLPGDRWTAESPISGVADGVSHRLDRERCLGNAVVPKCAEIAARVLREWIGIARAS